MKTKEAAKSMARPTSLSSCSSDNAKLVSSCLSLFNGIQANNFGDLKGEDLGGGGSRWFGTGISGLQPNVPLSIKSLKFYPS